MHWSSKFSQKRQYDLCPSKKGLSFPPYTSRKTFLATFCFSGSREQRSENGCEKVGGEPKKSRRRERRFYFFGFAARGATLKWNEIDAEGIWRIKWAQMKFIEFCFPRWALSSPLKEIFLHIGCIFCFLPKLDWSLDEDDRLSSLHIEWMSRGRERGIIILWPIMYNSKQWKFLSEGRKLLTGVPAQFLTMQKTP